MVSATVLPVRDVNTALHEKKKKKKQPQVKANWFPVSLVATRGNAGLLFPQAYKAYKSNTIKKEIIPYLYLESQYSLQRFLAHQFAICLFHEVMVCLSVKSLPSVGTV